MAYDEEFWTPDKEILDMYEPQFTDVEQRYDIHTLAEDRREEGRFHIHVAIISGRIACAAAVFYNENVNHIATVKGTISGFTAFIAGIVAFGGVASSRFEYRAARELQAEADAMEC
jgi:hypothetical protein